MIYLGYFDVEENSGQNRNYVLSASQKMSYISHTLKNAGAENIHIISASGTLDYQKYYKGKLLWLEHGITLRLFSSFNSSFAPLRVSLRFLSKLRLLLYLAAHIRKHEDVLVYHSLGYANVVRALKSIRKFNLILEIEEIYSDVSELEHERKIEEKVFPLADAFLFSTELLAEKINVSHKPAAVIYGTYSIEQKRNVRAEDGKLHAVYAGTFDPRKGGAVMAAKAAAFLPDNYHVHILGFGSDDDTRDLVREINRVNAHSAAIVTYDGKKHGEDYIRFLQRCDIGLSTQDPDGAFNDTSFPSKILSYMSNGLKVVSARIPVVCRSKISQNIVYYDENTPDEIAGAILVSAASEHDSKSLLEELDRQLIENIRQLLREGKHGNEQ